MARKNAKFEMQELFIQHLKEMVPANLSLVDELADLLEISVDSAYRRLRNETELSLDEAYKICKRYRISADGLFSSQVNAVTCNYTKLTATNNNIEKYLTGILEQLKVVTKTPNAKLIYAAEEVPIFHSFHSEKLAAFKLFYWQRSVINVAEYQTQKFNRTIIPENQIKLTSDIYKTYLQTESTEIWTKNTIETNINQIEYYFEAGLFENTDDAITLLMDLKEMVSSINRFVEKENKNEKNTAHIAPFSLYKSDLIIGTNCIHVNLNGTSFSCISFNTLNSLTAFNDDFCNEIDSWMKNLVKKSTLISGTAEKQRFQFFNSMQQKIDKSIEKIKNT